MELRAAVPVMQPVPAHATSQGNTDQNDPYLLTQTTLPAISHFTSAQTVHVNKVLWVP